MMTTLLRPSLRGGGAGKSPKPRLLSRKQQASLGIKVVAAFLLVIFVLVIAFIPHGGAGRGGTMGKRMAGRGPTTTTKKNGADASAAGAATASTKSTSTSTTTAATAVSLGRTD
jgi:hypothetical protein